MGMRRARRSTSPMKTASPRPCSSTTAAADTTLSEPVRRPSETSQELIDGIGEVQKRELAPEGVTFNAIPSVAFGDPVGVWPTKGQKRPFDSEGEHSSKRRRPSESESRLSKKNLKRLQRDLERLERRTPEEMDPSVTAPSRAKKRTASRQPSSSDLNQDTASVRSQKSAVSNSVYRYHTLEQARIYVRPEPPPSNIQTRMDIVFKLELPEERKREISRVAQETSQQFILNLRGANREDDLVELVHDAFRMMYKDQTFAFVRKAGILST